MGWASLVALALAGGGAGAAAARWRGRLFRSVGVFFTEPSGPLNLALARVAFFADVLWELANRGLASTEAYTRLPKALMSPPHGLGTLLASLPINPAAVRLTWVALIAAGLLGLLGILPRVAGLVVFLAGFYYLGVPQLYGKVDHDHHLLWIAAIFAVSPSADALSPQVVWRRWRGAGRLDRGPVRSVRYSLPLRFIWLTLGLLYLSAGLAKYRFDGLQWLEPHTLRYWMHLLWLQAGGYRPPILHRPDRLSALLTIGAAYTLLLETTFVLWIFSPRARPVLALAGLLFHNSTNLLLGIPFWDLQLLYVTLIDWDGILSWARRRWRGPPIAAGSEAVRPAAVRPMVFVGVAQLVVILATFLPGLRSAAASRASIASWPYAAYPSFAGYGGNLMVQMAVERLSPAGALTGVDLRQRLPFMSHERLTGLEQTILAEHRPASQRAEILALLAATHLCSERDPVFVVRQVVRLDPARAGQVVHSRTLLLSRGSFRAPARRGTSSCTAL